MWCFDHVITWQLKNLIPALPQHLWLPSFSEWWVRTGWAHSTSHVIVWPGGHLTNKPYICTSQQLAPNLAANLAVRWLRIWGLHPPCRMTFLILQPRDWWKKIICTFTMAVAAKFRHYLQIEFWFRVGGPKHPSHGTLQTSSCCNIICYWCLLFVSNSLCSGNSFCFFI